MSATSYLQRRGQLERYFDRTALRSWEALTSDAPVSRIRATVRAGRERMRRLILDRLPTHLADIRVLDAGCGPGSLAPVLAARGAQVVAIDLSTQLVELARRRTAAELLSSIDYRVGDMSDPRLGEFDYVVAMDSLIHYTCADILGVLRDLTQRTHRALLFTFAPKTVPLALMHAVGRVFPKADRAPAIEPVAPRRLQRCMACDPALRSWRVADSERVASGFYTSQLLQLVRT